MATPNYTPSDVDRFWSKVDNSGGNDACWIWTASRNNKGYGEFWLDGRMRKANRIAWLFFHAWLPDDLDVLHNCPGGDNPACVNPSHLWLGTHQDNMDDRNRKGRQGRSCGDKNGSRKYPERLLRGDQHPLRRNPELSARGSRVGTAKLREEQIFAIRERYKKGGITHKELAHEYGVSRPTITAVIGRRNWKHMV